MSEIDFTSDEEINAFENFEKNLNITGYVDAIDGIKSVQLNQNWIFTFDLNNNESTRMKILFWGSMAQTWEPRIHKNDIVEIIGGYVKQSHEVYRDPNVHLLEFYVQSSSKITILGTHTPSSIPTYKSINLSQVMFEEENVEIQCYVRKLFREVQFYSTKCGQGQVTDGFYRLTVNISDYTENEMLKAGVPIKIFGKMDKANSYFLVTKMTGIQIIENKPLLSKEKIKKGFHPVTQAKRKIDEDIPEHEIDKINKNEVGTTLKIVLNIYPDMLPMKIDKIKAYKLKVLKKKLLKKQKI